MPLPRRRFLQLAAGAAALPAMPRVASAQAWPSRPVRMIVPYAAGGSPDILGRLLGPFLSERFGQQFIVDNRPGGGSNIGTEVVVNAADGHTLLIIAPANAINASLYDKLSFNFIRDIAPVAGIMRVANVMAVHPLVPAKSVPEFIAYAKKNPGKINMASGGIGTANHVSGELFKLLTGVDMVHVPYRGVAPSLVDLIGGQVQVNFSGLPAAIEYIRAGKLRALAVTTSERAAALPDVPTVAEFVPGFEASSWWGVGAPRNMPAEIVLRLNKEINAALVEPKINAQLTTTLGGTVLSGSPADFGKLIAGETEKWAKVVKFSGARPE
jgi:tripartite-type tricarboxylate transporter receptor subunit TctC